MLTGALGVRTVHQRDAKAQLVVKTSEAASDESAAESGDESDWLDAAAAGAAAAAGDESGARLGEAQQSAAQRARRAEMEGLSGESEVLPVPRFINAEGEYDRITFTWPVRSESAGVTHLKPWVSLIG